MRTDGELVWLKQIAGERRTSIPGLTGRVEDLVRALVLVELDEVVASVSEVLTRVVVLGMVDKVLADGSGHGKTAIRVDVDLADSALDSLADLVLGDADSVLDLSTVLVDGGNVLLGNRRRAVEDNGEAGDADLDLVEDVETEVGLGARRELDHTVAGADGDGKAVNASALDKVLHLVGAGVVALLSSNIVLNASKDTELALNSNVELVRVVDNLLGESNVLVVGKGRTVDHNVGEAALDAGNNKLVAVTVVEVESNGDALAVSADLLGVLDSTLSHVAQKSLVRIGTSTLGNLQDDRALALGAGSDNSLHLLHVVEVKGRNSKPTINSTAEHLTGVHKTKILVGNHLKYP